MSILDDAEVELEAAPGQRVNEWHGVPEGLVPVINKYWQKPHRGPILWIKASERRQDAWQALGAVLSAAVCEQAMSVGVYADGHCGKGRIASWRRRVHEGSSIPMGHLYMEFCEDGDEEYSDLHWCALQSANTASWLQDIWALTDSNLFDYGCDLIITAYSDDMVANTKKLTDRIFERTVKQASCWMVPMYDNVGYVVGVSPASHLYSRLAQRTVSHEQR